jgi:hypothetical protein
MTQHYRLMSRAHRNHQQLGNEYHGYRNQAG